MKLRKGSRYHCMGSALFVTILNITYEHRDYYKVKTELRYKSNKMICETPRNYKLWKKNIAHWENYLPEGVH